MKGDLRRNDILKRLSGASSPVSAGHLAQEYNVSRQIIVKDIARLRADGAEIISLSKGYVLSASAVPECVFKVFHSDDDVKTELNLIVDLGGSVKDVFIYHKVYNKVSAAMNIKTRSDVEKFIEGVTSGKSKLLKNATSGYHYHTVSAENEETLSIIKDKLEEAGFLAPLQEYEPDELYNKKR